MKNTAHVVDFIVGSRFEGIPPQALAVAKGAMLDCVGVALAGARLPSSTAPRHMHSTMTT
jgi:2-methylcitrate dehydratase PrpD